MFGLVGFGPTTHRACAIALSRLSYKPFLFFSIDELSVVVHILLRYRDHTADLVAFGFG